MPITQDNVGYSEFTLSKTYNFQKIAEMHINMSKGIISRTSWCDSQYFYMDLTAGTGTIPNTNLPNCARIMTEKLRSIGVQFQAHFIDQENTDSLRGYLGLSPALHYYKGDHNQIAKDVITKYVKKPPYGLIFYDPNSPGIINGQWPSLNSVAEIYRDSSQLDQVDFIMYLSATAVKRVRHLTNKKLEDWLTQINKQHWLVRRPQGKWQWTFIMGTNWKAYPKIRTIGFYPSNTPEGNIIFEDINLTNDELRKLRNQQLSLFDEQESDSSLLP